MCDRLQRDLLERCPQTDAAVPVADEAVERLVLTTVRAASQIVLERLPVDRVLAKQPAQLVSVALWSLTYQRWLVTLLLVWAASGVACSAGPLSFVSRVAF